MHDWTLLDMSYSWKDKEYVVRLLDQSSNITYVKAFNVQRVAFTHIEEWGPSVSVNSFEEHKDNNGVQEIDIEMQTGDVINIVAERIIILSDNCVNIP